MPQLSLALERIEDPDPRHKAVPGTCLSFFTFKRIVAVTAVNRVESPTQPSPMSDAVGPHSRALSLLILTVPKMEFYHIVTPSNTFTHSRYLWAMFSTACWR
jgi:hypothetical protein